MPALESLRERLAELADLSSLGRAGRLGPAHDDAARGRAARAHRDVATLERITHERATGRRDRRGWIAEARDATATRTRRATPDSCASRGATGTADARARRPRRRDRAGRPPRARSVVAGRRARRRLRRCSRPRSSATSSCARELRRLLRRLRAPLRRAARRLRLRVDGVARAADLRRRWREALPPLVDEAAAAAGRRDAVDGARGARQQARGPRRPRAASASTRDGWRVDVSAAPLHGLAMSRRDLRITTRYDAAGFESLLAALHEFGHGLYERQIARRAGAHQPRPRHLDVDPRVAEQAVGEPRRPPSRLRRR